KSSGVPRGRIYEVLGSLERRGVVSVSPEKPARYTALPVSALLDSESASIEERLKAVEPIRRAFEETGARKPQSTTAGPSPHVFVLRGAKGVLERLRSMMADAKETIDLQMTSRTLERASSLVGKLPRKGPQSARKVRVLVAAPRPTETGPLKEFMARDSQPQIRVAESGDLVSCAIADSARVLIWTTGSAPGDQGDFGVWTDDPGVVGGFAAVFESGWTTASDPEAILRRLTSGTPGPGFILLRSAMETGPRLLDSIRHAKDEVLDLTSGARLARRPEGLVERDKLPRGLSVRGLTHVTPENSKNLRGLPEGFNVHHIPQDLGLRFTVVDGRETYVYRPIAPGEEPEDPFSDTLYSADPQVAHVYRNLFEHLWAQSLPLAERLRAIDEGSAGSETRVIRDLDTAYNALGDALQGPWKECRVITIGQALTAGASMFTATAEGRNVKIVLHITADAIGAVETLAAQGVEFRHLPFELGLRSVGLDRSATFLMQGGTFQGEAEGGEEESLVMIHSTDPGFAEVQARLHDALWEIAVPLRNRAQEIAEGRPAPETRVVHDAAELARIVGESLVAVEEELLSITTSPALVRSAGVFSRFTTGFGGSRHSRVLLHVTEEAADTVAQLTANGIEIRHLPFDSGLRWAIFDRKKVLMLPAGSPYPGPSGPGDRGAETFIVSTHPDIAAAFARQHEYLWSIAVPAEKRLAELDRVRTDRGGEVPR
ncbi:MAG TPA: helix-turn-helix domain-containing protein, partial [Thermoplasmata archaeon]|nr:helix-turn-helix domain-containing protein [Thermoplasmata archaeon]